MTHIFAKSIFGFSKILLDNPDIILPVSNAYFGTLELQAASTPITSVEQEVVCVVDQSGSMSDLCKDDRTKMQHIIHTLKNIIYYFVENPVVTVFLSVYSFDDGFHTILERTKITKEDLQMMLDKMDKIRPMGNTNIENALINVGDIIHKLTTEYPTHVVNHIFMTDGEATVGNKDKNVLKEIVNTTIQNAFIGFGDNHDSYLLNFLASNPRSNYYFIDALENSGLIYGEVLHNILYKVLTDVTIEILNGFIYEYKTNTWVQKMAICDIAGEADKVYHIGSTTPDECCIFVEGIHNNEIVRFDINKLLIMETDFTKYIYRQRTLQLLYESNELHEVNIDNKGLGFNIKWEFIDGKIEAKKNCRLKLRTFLEELKKYMNDNNLQEDKFLKNLCDDIYICYRTLGTKYGGMYTAARQTSQGNQRCYTVTNIPDDDYNTADNLTDYKLNLPIHINHNSINNSNKINNSIFLQNINLNDAQVEPLLHEISQFDETPYLTPTATRLMRDISMNRESIETDEAT
jgi:hypothetical protein